MVMMMLRNIPQALLMACGQLISILLIIIMKVEDI